jgi:adenylate cyclase
MRKFNINIGGKGNARVIFSQSLEQSELIYNLYDLFKDFCASPPKEFSSLIKESNKLRYNISFATRNLPCFNELYSLFYENRIKIIPSNIEELLTPVVLAY